MKIDQQTLEFWSLVKDFILLTGTIITVFLAVRGFNKWKKETKWRIYVDFSHRFLKNVYTIRDILWEVRGPFIGANEFMPEYKVVPGKSDGEMEHKNKYFIFSNRVDRLKDQGKEFNSHLAEAEALMGKEFRNKYCRSLVNQLNEYRQAVEYHLRLEEFGKDDYYLKQIHPVVFRSDEKDEFDTKVTSIIEQMERELLPFLKVSKP